MTTDDLTDEQRWLRELFEFESCAECGQDETGHMVSPDPLGLPHAWCLHYHVARHSDDDDIYSTYDMGDAMHYAYQELEQYADSEHDGISAYGEAGEFEDAYRCWERCERWGDLATNAKVIYKQYAFAAADRAPAYRSDDPDTLARRRKHAEHVIDLINDGGPDGFRMWVCVMSECAPTDDDDE